MTSHAKEDVFTIVQGPDRLDIMMAFANYNPHEKFQDRGDFPDAVDFVTKDGKRDVNFYVMISGLQHEDGSGISWNVEGYLVRVNPIPHGVGMVSDLHLGTTRRIHIRYRTDKKEGILRILP